MYIEYTPLEGQLKTYLRNPVTAAALLAHVEAAEEAAATQVLHLQAEAVEDEADAAAAVVSAASVGNSARLGGAAEGVALHRTDRNLIDNVKEHQGFTFKAATERKVIQALQENFEQFHNGVNKKEEEEEEENFELIDIIDEEDTIAEKDKNEKSVKAKQPILENGIVVQQKSGQNLEQDNKFVFELEDEDFEYVVTKVKKKCSGLKKFERSLHKTISTPISITKAKKRPIPAAIPIVVHRNKYCSSVKPSKSAPALRVLNGNLDNYCRSISQDSFRSRYDSQSDTDCSTHSYIYTRRPQKYSSAARYDNGFPTVDIEDEEGYSFNETHFELVQGAGGDYCVQANDFPVNKYNRPQDSQMGIDIFAKLRNLLNLNSDSKVDRNEGKRKRRSNDWAPDAAAVHQIKYRKVDNHFPKIITGPLDNDLDSFPFPKKPEKPLLLQQHHYNNNQPRFVNVPLGMSHRRPIHSTENTTKPGRKSLFDVPQHTRKVVKNHSYAEVEFSDDDDLEFANGLGTAAFSGGRNQHDFGRTPRVHNIPISHRSEERMKYSVKQPPPLIDASTGSILASTLNLPEISQTRPTYAETLRENLRFGNVMQTHRPPSSSSSSSVASTSSFTRNLFNGFGKCCRKTSSSFPKRSVLEQGTQSEDREKYEELLRQYVPQLYDNNGDISPPYKVMPNSIAKPKRSTLLLDDVATLTANNSLFGNQRHLNRPPLTSTINLDDDEDVEVTFDTTASTLQKKHDAKHENDQTLVIDDDDVSEIINLDAEERQILSACAKVTNNYTNFKNNEVEKENYRKRNELPQVEPVNSLKLQFSTSPHLKENWLENYQAKYDKKKKERHEQAVQFEKEADKQATLRRKAELDIQERLRNCKLYSPDLVIIDDFPEPEEEEPDLVQFTDQHTARIQSAIRGPPDQVLISKFNLNITRRDIHTLLGQNWLNDEVINFYMNLLTERGETKHKSHGMPRVYAMNTFFVPRLMQAGHSGVKRWTRKVDIFAMDIIPVPVHVGGVHWCMAIIHLKDRTIKYYDSMGTPNPNVLKALEQYLKDESMDKRKQPFDTSNFEIESVRDVPRQMNGSDCGVFSCMFAEFICRNKRITFTQQHMEYFRHKMVLEIVQGELLQ